MKELPSLKNCKNELKIKSTYFAVRVVKLVRHVQKNHHEFVLSKQLLRSGTSIGANIRESERAESADDFIHKLSISLKEANETIFWLELYYADDILSEQEFISIYADTEELLKMLGQQHQHKKTEQGEMNAEFRMQNAELLPLLIASFRY